MVGQAEGVASHFAEFLIGGPPAEIVVRGKSVSEMLDIIERIAPLRTELGPIQEDIREDLRNLRASMGTRNFMVHGFWDSADVPRGSLLSVRVSRRSGARELRDLTAVDIEKAAQRLADATNDLHL